MARQQLEMYGERLDGERLSAEARLDPKNDGAGLLFTPTRWKAVGHPEGILTRLLTATSEEGWVTSPVGRAIDLGPLSKSWTSVLAVPFGPS